MKPRKPIPKHHDKEHARRLLGEVLELLGKLIELIGDSVMGKAELDAALVAQTAAVAKLNSDVAALLAAGAGATDLTSETQQVNDNTTTVNSIDSTVVAAMPPVVTP